jgi:hypothetical protein
MLGAGGCVRRADGVDDRTQFDAMRAAFATVGFGDEAQAGRGGDRST